MKVKQIRAFLEEFLLAQGAEAERRGENLLAVRLPRKLASTIGTKELVLAFNLRGVQEDPHSELGTVGNPLFDRILELAREVGRVGERYHPVPKPNGPPPDPRKQLRILPKDIQVGRPETVYTPLLFLLFRTEYSLEDQADELEVVPLDSVSLQSLPQIPELGDYWEKLLPEPEPSRAVMPAFPLLRPQLDAAIALLERRLRKRLAKIRRDSEDLLARETMSIGSYYRQLIEETRNSGRRWTLTAVQREERIRVLQLDWKRRAEEAQQYWRPRIDVTLVSVAAAQLPRLAFPLRVAAPAAGPKARARAATPHVFWDELDRRFVEPACGHCGRTGLSEVHVAADRLMCSSCRETIPSNPAGLGQSKKVTAKQAK